MRRNIKSFDKKVTESVKKNMIGSVNKKVTVRVDKDGAESVNNKVAVDVKQKMIVSAGTNVLGVQTRK